MKLLKTDFGKVHAVVATVALINVVVAMLLKLGLIRGSLYSVAVTTHVVCGFLILPALLLLPLAFSTRAKLYRAIRVRLLPGRRDFTGKHKMMLAAKIVTMLVAVGFLCQTVTALLMRTGLAGRWFPAFDTYGFHTAFIFVLPVLVVLHLILMKLAHRQSKR
jgi:hypothetical protein